MVAAALYPWSTAESIMRHARQRSLPRLPNSLVNLAACFENGQLHQFSCCNDTLFRGCVQDVDGKNCVNFACNTLIQNVINNDVVELHADATFKVVPLNMGYQMLTLHLHG